MAWLGYVWIHRMILSGHQPCYLPGIQLFNKIMLSDAFMFVGHCDYEDGSWQNRNYIRTGLLTVPCHHGKSINDTEIVGGAWRRKHLNAIRLAYSKFPYFSNYYPALKDVLEVDGLPLGSLNRILTRLILVWLGIKIFAADSRAYDIQGKKEDMLISMCRAAEADEYLSNEGSRKYIGPEQEAKMALAGIAHRWQNFENPDYGQEKTINGGRLSVIDLLFRLGPEARDIVKKGGVIQ